MRKKIVLIGPVYPFKGGIAHYTSLMYKTLENKYDIEMISYKMQYPKLLFKKEQKDFSNDMFKIEGAKFLINTANPFNIIHVGNTIRKMRPHAVIIQWWHPYFAPCYWILGKVLGRKIKKMFICHNVFPHERFPLDHWLTKLALKNGDSYIVHSLSDGKDLGRIKSNVQFRFNPHPTYNVFKIRNISKNEARTELGKRTDERILLFFGFVREYKGLKHLLRAMPEVKQKLGKITLMVVGSFGDDKDEYLKLIEQEQIIENVEIIDGYTPDHEVEKYFAGCDLVVLPYESATQSGIVQIAFGFNKPVIATNVGGLPDVVDDHKTGYIIKPKDSHKLAEVIIDYYQNQREEKFSMNVEQEAERFSWDRMRVTIERLID